MSSYGRYFFKSFHLKPCECCGQRDYKEVYITCPHCSVRLCFLCANVHPSPETCKKRSHVCAHGRADIGVLRFEMKFLGGEKHG